jgi:alpha-mannosidase
VLEGDINGRRTGFAVINSGQHGFDFKDGEIRLSVLRSAAFCHDQGFKIAEPPAMKFMDQGIHEIRLLVTAGDANAVRSSLSGLADWLSAPPIVYSHLPIGEKVGQSNEFMTLQPRTIRLLATKRSEDGKALILRLQETIGVRTKAKVSAVRTKSGFVLSFKPFEIKTIRLEKPGSLREVALIEEE